MKIYWHYSVKQWLTIILALTLWNLGKITTSWVNYGTSDWLGQKWWYSSNSHFFWPVHFFITHTLIFYIHFEGLNLDRNFYKNENCHFARYYMVLNKSWSPPQTNLPLLNYYPSTFWNFWQNISKVGFSVWGEST